MVKEPRRPLQSHLSLLRQILNHSKDFPRADRAKVDFGRVKQEA